MEYKTSEQKMKFYKSKVWVELRERILHRDNYECQECKQLGYVKLHDESKHKSLDVDHIKEIYTHPQLALESDNLRTLCIHHHNKKHNRFQHRFKHKKKEQNEEMW